MTPAMKMKALRNSRLLQAGLLISLALLLFTIPAGASSPCNAVSLRSVTIIAAEEMLATPVTKTTIDDVLQLLRKGFGNLDVSLNNSGARIKIIPDISNPAAQAGGSRLAEGSGHDNLRHPDQGYQWDSSCEDGTILLRLRSPSYEGISFGLYGLLQEKLGFKFYHPRRTIIPDHPYWPLPVGFHWKAVPRFYRRGFHIHTLHPVELSRQLLEPSCPGGLSDIKQYIDWLARNQQNLFQFFLLRGIDRGQWTAHAAEFVAYAHKRGVLAGVEISLSMLQQRAFQTIKVLKPLSSYRKEVDGTLAWLFKVPWDFVTVDFTMGEYLPDLGTLMPGLKEYVVERITGEYGTKLLFTTHVTAEEEGPASSGRPGIRPGGETGGTGILIHTVMFYSIDEPDAPVYGHKNQRFMLRRAIRENRRREVWYWPESAYWVAFDNSVPLLLLPYLEARWSDMVTMERIGVDNHLTFSSGWEWGYWLVDWSIARWSWEYTGKGASRESDPLGILRDIFPAPDIQQLWEEALQLQDHYLKRLGLISLLAALDPSAELPWPFDKPFQPRPPFTYRWLLREASDNETARILAGPVESLDEYARKMDLVTEKLDIRTASLIKRSGSSPELEVIALELTRALAVTALRARHRALVLKALIAMRGRDENGLEARGFLKKAGAIRLRAQRLVLEQERIYRYPVNQIARRRRSLTAYDFGYLYPVSNLHFWKREEEQIRNRRFDAFYMSIWDYARITGIDSLCR